MATDLDENAARKLADHIARLAAAVRDLREIYDEHAGVRDRFFGAGQVNRELARRLGLIGLAGRASGNSFDARIDMPSPPYDSLQARKMEREAGDVAARVAIRFDELQESCRLVELILGSMPPGPYRIDAGTPSSGVLSVGWIEGWRGPALVALEIVRTGAFGAVIRTTRPGRTGRRWSTRSSATSCPTSPSSISRSICRTAVTTCKAKPC